ncbi:MAG: acyl-CoA thioesterase [Casimicrobiaceae bacterium]
MNDSREAFRHWLVIPTRWMDNDVYGHVNNVVYYAWFDTVINRYLIDAGGLDIHTSPVVGYCVESGCTYRRSFSFPESVEAGLRVTRLGRSSVRYEVGLFGTGEPTARALGYFVHVFVDRRAARSTAIPASIRHALEQIAVD